MRYISLGLIFLLPLIVSANEPTDAQIEKYLELSSGKNTYAENIHSMYAPLQKMVELDLIKVKNKDKARKIADRILHSFTWENIKPDVLAFYKKHYTDKEMQQMIKTMSTPEMRKIKEKEAALSKEYDIMLQKITIQNLVRIAVETELEDKLK